MPARMNHYEKERHDEKQVPGQRAAKRHLRSPPGDGLKSIPPGLYVSREPQGAEAFGPPKALQEADVTSTVSDGEAPASKEDMIWRQQWANRTAEEKEFDD